MEEEELAPPPGIGGDNIVAVNANLLPEGEQPVGFDQVQGLHDAARRAHEALENGINRLGDVAEDVKANLLKAIGNMAKERRQLPRDFKPDHLYKVHEKYKTNISELIANLTEMVQEEIQNLLQAEQEAHENLSQAARKLRSPNADALKDLRDNLTKGGVKFEGQTPEDLRRFMGKPNQNGIIELMYGENKVMVTPDGYAYSESAEALAAKLASSGGNIILGKKPDGELFTQRRLLRKVERILREKYGYGQKPGQSITIGDGVKMGMRIKNIRALSTLLGKQEYMHPIEFNEATQVNCFNAEFVKDKAYKTARAFLRIRSVAKYGTSAHFAHRRLINAEAPTAAEKAAVFKAIKEIQIETGDQLILAEGGAALHEGDSNKEIDIFSERFREIFRMNFVPYKQRKEFDALVPARREVVEGLDEVVDPNLQQVNPHEELEQQPINPNEQEEGGEELEGQPVNPNEQEEGDEEELGQEGRKPDLKDNRGDRGHGMN